MSLPLLFFVFVVGSFLVNAMRSRSLSYVSGNRALNRSLGGSSIAPVILGGLLGSALGNRGGGGFGGGGGGGFSGGGGDFGGGGASGDW